MTDFLGIIPARYASSRFPGKPLALLGDKPMIQWVYERASVLFDHLLVATDDRRIEEAVKAFGGKVVMTSDRHESGTERCAEAARLFSKQTGLDFSHIINIQGDEPLVQKEQLQALVDCLQESEAGIATLIKPLQETADLDNPNVVKVVVDQSMRALYFSRSPIPYVRDKEKTSQPEFYTHIGLYGFRREVLERVVTLASTPLERAESLEQLRWMEHGIEIHTALTQFPSLGVDTPEDLEKIRKQEIF